MANVKFTEDDWDRAKEYFEAGLSLGKISDKTGIDKAAISKRAKNNGWIKNNSQKQQLISDATQVQVMKSMLGPKELSVHDELVHENTRHILFFNNAALQNVREAMKAGCDNQADFRARAETINKGREAVLGKAPDTAININNNNAAQTPASSAKEWLSSIVSDINAG